MWFQEVDEPMFRRVFLASLAAGAILCVPMGAMAAEFKLSKIELAPLKKANLCGKIGGQGQQPVLVINYAPVAGVTIRVRMYDDHGKGKITEHNTVKVKSSGSGKTVVNAGFRPPCNTTNGKRSSSYRFDIIAKGQKATVKWGDYDSAKKRIVN